MVIMKGVPKIEATVVYVSATIHYWLAWGLEEIDFMVSILVGVFAILYTIIKITESDTGQKLISWIKDKYGKLRE